MKKKDLADLAVKLYNNIDQSEQFDTYQLFYHCDKKFLINIIEDLAETVKYNIEQDKKLSKDYKNIGVDSVELTEIFELVEKVLKEKDKQCLKT